MADPVEDLVRGFVDQLRDVIRDEIRATLEGRFSGSGASKRSVKVSASKPASNGSKRSADELEALQAKFYAFVVRNPGLRIEQINKQLGDTSTKELMLPVKKLIAERKIVGTGNRRATVYLPAGANGTLKKRGRKAKAG